MIRSTRERTGSDVSIARAGEETKYLPFEAGMTVSEALRKANVSLSSSEEVYVESEDAKLEDELESGDMIQISGKKEGGR